MYSYLPEPRDRSQDPYSILDIGLYACWTGSSSRHRHRLYCLIWVSCTRWIIPRERTKMESETHRSCRKKCYPPQMIHHHSLATFPRISNIQFLLLSIESIHQLYNLSNPSNGRRSSSTSHQRRFPSPSPVLPHIHPRKPLQSRPNPLLPRIRLQPLRPDRDRDPNPKPHLPPRRTTQSTPPTPPHRRVPLLRHPPQRKPPTPFPSPLPKPNPPQPH